MSCRQPGRICRWIGWEKTASLLYRCPWSDRDMNNSWRIQAWFDGLTHLKNGLDRIISDISLDPLALFCSSLEEQCVTDGSRYYKYLDAEQLHQTRLICWAIYENIVSTFFWESPQVLVGYQSWGLETIEERQQLLLTCLEGVIRLMMIYWWYDENSSCLSLQQGSKRWHQQIECKWPFEASQYGDSLTKNNATAMTTGWKIKSC